MGQITQPSAAAAPPLSESAPFPCAAAIPMRQTAPYQSQTFAPISFPAPHHSQSRQDCQSPRSGTHYTQAKSTGKPTVEKAQNISVDMFLQFNDFILFFIKVRIETFFSLQSQ